MRILSVHNRYQERGGEDSVVDAEARLLEQQGHEVIRLGLTNDQIPNRRSLSTNIILATATVWSVSGRQRVDEALRTFDPDVVHFHNTFPLLSPAAYGPASARRIPAIQTLHNYRLLCPNALFFRDGHTCEDCLGKTLPWPGALHACYRDSRGQTSVVAAMLTVHRLRGTWHHEVDRFITPTNFARNKFIDGGLPADRISVKPNFPPVDPGRSRVEGTTMLFVGRLVDYKGVHPLLDAWSEHNLQSPLRIVGDGPLGQCVRQRANAHPAITNVGPLVRPDVFDEMKRARAVVVPSLLYETFGTIIVEAFACGTPVIASRLGAMAEIVEDGITGLLFEPGNAEDLAAKVRWANQHPAEMRQMGENGRREYEAAYTPERNYAMLMDIYEQAIDHARQRRRESSHRRVEVMG